MNFKEKTSAELIDELKELQQKMDNMKSSHQQDLSEYKRAISELQFYRIILENITEGVLLTSASNGSIIYTNHKFEQMFGYGPLELVGQSVSKINAPSGKSPEEIAAEIMQQLKANGYWEGDLKNIRKDGTIFWCHAIVSAFEHSRFGKIWIAVHNDISENKQIKENLQTSDDKHKIILQTAMDGFWLADKHGNLVEVNAAYSRMSGYSKQELLEMNISDLEVIESESDTSRHMQKISIQEGDRFESRHRRKDGSIFDVEISVQYKPIEGGRYVAFLHDITERKKILNEIITAKVKAEESDRLKSAFLANMSHEIRTPMNGILGFAELLKEPMLSDEEQQKYIKVIHKSGKRMLGIINDIVSISKIESGQMHVSISATTINEQIESVYFFYLPEVEKKGLLLSIKNSLPAKQSRIKTDREKLYAILTNLVNNAIKFTSKGSIEFGYEKKGEFLEFFVKDTGSGVPEQKKEIIFERFRQGSELITKPYDGAGLGLSISKGYVEMLGGKIWVESQPGEGSTFYFTLPYNTQSDAKKIIRKAATEPVGIYKGKELKVLVVEDDDESQFIISTVLKKFGKEILQAGTGSEAVETCRINPGLDLVLMDVRLPEMDGYEATRQIRQFNKDIIIIAQTAYGFSDDREKAIAARCNDYISKPIVIEDLTGLIQKYFSK